MIEDKTISVNPRKMSEVKTFITNVEKMLREKKGDLVQLVVEEEDNDNLRHIFLYLAKYCPNIEVFSFSPTCFEIDFLQLQHFTRRCSAITNFSIEDIKKSFTDDHLLLILSSQWPLKTLKLMWAPITNKYLNCLPSSLESIDLRRCTNITVLDLPYIAARCPNLLQLRTSLIYDQHKLDGVCHHWPNLKSLIVNCVTELSFKNFTNLTDLYLSSAMKSFSINTILQSLKSLESLQVGLVSAKKEILFLDNHLKKIIIRTKNPLPQEVLFSLPSCASLEIIDIAGTDMWIVMEELLKKCKKLKVINALDTVVESQLYDHFRSTVTYGRGVMIQMRVIEPPETDA